jgi:ABC-type antimicrobial peptide transport system ATPase subunit
MDRPFNAAEETSQSQNFRTLAALFQRTDNTEISESLHILAQLSEQKARILAQLNECPIFNATEPDRRGLVEWPIKKAVGDN